MRLFVAVDPPDGALPGVRNPHVTLRFLGDVPGEEVPTIEAALRAGLAGVAAPEAELGTVVRRLGRGALVVDVHGLDGLAAAVRSALTRWGGDDRPFRGHLTLARRRRGVPAPGSRPSDGVEPAGPAAVVRWRVGAVLLVRSELGRGAGGSARHTVVASVSLGG